MPLRPGSQKSFFNPKSSAAAREWDLNKNIGLCCLFEYLTCLLRNLYAGQEATVRTRSASISSWQINGETMETVTDFILLGSKIMADGDYSCEIKRHLFLGRKAMTNLDSILKSRDTTLLKMTHLLKAMVFPVVIYGCESWTLRKLSTEELMLLNCGFGEDS